MKQNTKPGAVISSRGSTARWSRHKKQGGEGHAEWEAATAIWLDQPVRGWRGLETKAAEGREGFLAGMWEELPRKRAEVVYTFSWW